MNRCCEPDCNLDELAYGRCYSHARMHVADEAWRTAEMFPLILLLGLGIPLVFLLLAEKAGVISL